MTLQCRIKYFSNQFDQHKTPIFLNCSLSSSENSRRTSYEGKYYFPWRRYTLPWMRDINQIFGWLRTLFTLSYKVSKQFKKILLFTAKLRNMASLTHRIPSLSSLNKPHQKYTYCTHRVPTNLRQPYTTTFQVLIMQYYVQNRALHIHYTWCTNEKAALSPFRLVCRSPVRFTLMSLKIIYCTIEVSNGSNLHNFT